MRDALMNSDPDPQTKYPWLRGAVISGVGAVIGIIAFAVFCYSLGLSFSDEGWAGNRQPDWQANRNALIGSLVGLSVAILTFWLGFIQMTRR